MAAAVARLEPLTAANIAHPATEARASPPASRESHILAVK